MTSSLPFLIAFVFFQVSVGNPLPSRSLGTACVPFQGSPATGGKCDSVLSALEATLGQPTNILLRNSTYEELDGATGKQTLLMGAFVPPECRNPLVAFTCMGSFLQCRFSTGPGFLVYPPCRSVCEAVLLGCTAFFQSQGTLDQLPDCDVIDNSTGTPLPAFPPDGTQCLAMPPDLFVPYGESDCPYPLAFNYDHESTFEAVDYAGDVICVMPCPSPMWTDAEWTGGVTVMMVLGGCSLILGFFVGLSMLMMPRKRRYPGSLFLYICLCLIGINFVIVFFPIVSGGPTRMVCTHGNPPVEVTFGNARDYDGGGVPCIFQAIGLLYFSLAANFWWLALCINVFEMIFLRKSIQFVRKFHILYHLLAWGLPLVSVIICLGATVYGAAPEFPYCFVTGNEWWAWTLFYIPTGLSIITGTILMTAALFRMIRVRSRAGGFRGQTVEQVVRLFLLILAYWLLLVYPWAFRIYARVIQVCITQGDLTAAVEEQVACSAATGTDCELSERIDVGSWYLLLISLSCSGFVIFACLASTEVLNLWVEIHRIIYTQPWGKAIQQIRDLISGDTEEWSSKGGMYKHSSSFTTRSGDSSQAGDEDL